MAAFALDNVYPASDTMITSRTMTSILLSAIRYILPIPKSYIESSSSSIGASCLSKIRDLFEADEGACRPCHRCKVNLRDQ